MSCGAQQLDAGPHLGDEEVGDLDDRRVQRQAVLEEDVQLLLGRVGGGGAALDHGAELAGDRLLQQLVDLREDGLGVLAQLVGEGQLARRAGDGPARQPLAHEVAEPEALVDVVEQPAADLGAGPVVEDGQRGVDDVLLEVGAHLDERHERGDRVVVARRRQHLGLRHRRLRGGGGREAVGRGRAHQLAQQRGLAAAGRADDQDRAVARGLGRPREHHLAQAVERLTTHLGKPRRGSSTTCARTFGGYRRSGQPGRSSCSATGAALAGGQLGRPNQRSRRGNR